MGMKKTHNVLIIDSLEQYSVKDDPMFTTHKCKINIKVEARHPDDGVVVLERNMYASGSAYKPLEAARIAVQAMIDGNVIDRYMAGYDEVQMAKAVTVHNGIDHIDIRLTGEWKKLLEKVLDKKSYKKLKIRINERHRDNPKSNS